MRLWYDVVQSKLLLIPTFEQACPALSGVPKPGSPTPHTSQAIHPETSLVPPSTCSQTPDHFHHPRGNHPGPSRCPFRPSSRPPCFLPSSFRRLLHSAHREILQGGPSPLQPVLTAASSLPVCLRVFALPCPVPLSGKLFPQVATKLPTSPAVGPSWAALFKTAIPLSIPLQCIY